MARNTINTYAITCIAKWISVRRRRLCHAGENTKKKTIEKKNTFVLGRCIESRRSDAHRMNKSVWIVSVCVHALRLVAFINESAHFAPVACPACSFPSDIYYTRTIQYRLDSSYGSTQLPNELNWKLPQPTINRPLRLRISAFCTLCDVPSEG